MPANKMTIAGMARSYMGLQSPYIRFMPHNIGLAPLPNPLDRFCITARAYRG
jgi:hypothetical protein